MCPVYRVKPKRPRVYIGRTPWDGRNGTDSPWGNIAILVPLSWGSRGKPGKDGTMTSIGDKLRELRGTKSQTAPGVGASSSVPTDHCGPVRRPLYRPPPSLSWPLPNIIPTATGPITTVGRRARGVVATEARRLIVCSAPAHNHRHYRCHNGHEDANESHRPYQRQVRCGGQDSSQQPGHHRHPDQVLRELSASTLQKMPRRAHGHRLLHHSGVSAPCHDTEVAYPLATRSASLK